MTLADSTCFSILRSILEARPHLWDAILRWETTGDIPAQYLEQAVNNPVEPWEVMELEFVIKWSEVADLSDQVFIDCKCYDKVNWKDTWVPEACLRPPTVHMAMQMHPDPFPVMEHRPVSTLRALMCFSATTKDVLKTCASRSPICRQGWRKLRNNTWQLIMSKNVSKTMNNTVGTAIRNGTAHHTMWSGQHRAIARATLYNDTTRIHLRSHAIDRHAFGEASLNGAVAFEVQFIHIQAALVTSFKCQCRIPSTRSRDKRTT